MEEKKSKAKLDIVQIIDNEIAIACEIGDDEQVKKLTAFREFQEGLDKEISEKAQKKFRSSRYANIGWCRVNVNSLDLPVENINNKLSIYSKGILWALASFTTSQYIQISRKQICEITGLAPGTVSKAIKEIISLDVLTVAKKKTAHTATIYKWNPIYLQVGKISIDAKEIIDSESSETFHLLKSEPSHTVAIKKLPLGDGEQKFVAVVMNI